MHHDRCPGRNDASQPPTSEGNNRSRNLLGARASTVCARDTDGASLVAADRHVTLVRYDQRRASRATRQARRVVWIEDGPGIGSLAASGGAKLFTDRLADDFAARGPGSASRLSRPIPARSLRGTLGPLTIGTLATQTLSLMTTFLLLSDPEGAPSIEHFQYHPVRIKKCLTAGICYCR